MVSAERSQVTYPIGSLNELQYLHSITSDRRVRFMNFAGQPTYSESAVIKFDPAKYSV
jgi:hypothetical protein